jgi:hypothetical protein
MRTRVLYSRKKAEDFQSLGIVNVRSIVKGKLILVC